MSPPSLPHQLSAGNLPVVLHITDWMTKNLLKNNGKKQNGTK